MNAARIGRSLSSAKRAASRAGRRAQRSGRQPSPQAGRSKRIAGRGARSRPPRFRSSNGCGTTRGPVSVRNRRCGSNRRRCRDIPAPRSGELSSSRPGVWTRVSLPASGVDPPRARPPAPLLRLTGGLPEPLPAMPCALSSTFASSEPGGTGYDRLPPGTACVESVWSLWCRIRQRRHGS